MHSSTVSWDRFIIARCVECCVLFKPALSYINAIQLGHEKISHHGSTAVFIDRNFLASIKKYRSTTAPAHKAHQFPLGITASQSWTLNFIHSRSDNFVY